MVKYIHDVEEALRIYDQLGIDKYDFLTPGSKTDGDLRRCIVKYFTPHYLDKTPVNIMCFNIDDNNKTFDVSSKYVGIGYYRNLKIQRIKQKIDAR